jgi:uncharacterized protein
MEVTLNDNEVRVLGCMIEKELSTPDYYPLSLNALTNACNQKSNRDPLLSLEESNVVRAVDSLRFNQLVVLSSDGGRVPKYRHILSERMRLSPPELAVLGELMLRGPQTLGELRGRTERMHSFNDIAAVETVLEELMARTPPLLTRLSRQPGRKEPRYAHLFGGEPVQSDDQHNSSPDTAQERVLAGNERMVKLEEQMISLTTEVAELRRMIVDLKEQLE